MDRVTDTGANTGHGAGDGTAELAAPGRIPLAVVLVDRAGLVSHWSTGARRLFGTAKELKKSIGRIVTDSSPPEAPKDPATSNIFKIYQQVASAEQSAALADRYRAGIGWGDAKAALFELLDAQLREPREGYAALMADRARIDALLADGAARARAVAGPVLQRLRTAMGIAR